MQTPKKILIIEDEGSLIRALEDKLKSEHYGVLEARNGQAGLDIARDQIPDLILLDILMPGMNGLDALKEIKGDLELVNIPVIVLSNLPEESVKEKAKELGDTEFMVKSDVSLDEIVEKIKSYLDKSPKDK